METNKQQDIDKSDKGSDLLFKRIEDWKKQGIISEKQSRDILRYEDIKPVASSSYGRFITILATMGVVLIGLGIIILVGSNWQDIPVPVKMLMITGLIVVTNLFAYQFKYVLGYPRIGGALFFLAAICYGAGILLVAQTYDFKPFDPLPHPNLLVLWLVAILPVAYLTGSRAILSLSLIIALWTIGWKASSLILDYDGPNLYLALYLMVGVMFYTFGILHSKFKVISIYELPFSVVGSLVVLISSLMLGISELVSDVNGNENHLIGIGFIVLLSIVTVLTLTAGMASAVFKKNGGRISPYFIYELIVILVVILAAFWTVYTKPGSYSLTNVLAFNVIFLMLVVGNIVRGVQFNKAVFVNIGLIFFGIFVLFRYFELFFDAIGTALFFIIGGGVLLVLGFILEFIRRRITRDLRSSGGDIG